MPAFKNLGKKNKAINTNAITATTSQAITANPSLKAAPFKPTICSVDKLVSKSEPAIIGKVKDRPPKKKPAAEVFSVFRVIRNVTTAANKVKDKKDKITIDFVV